MKLNWRQIGDEFIQATSYKDSKEYIDTFKERPTYDYTLHNPYLSYPDAKVKLPLGEPEFPNCPSLWAVLQERRSRRKYLDKQLTLNELNILLWSMFGITGVVDWAKLPYKVRTVSSSGALYPIEGYMLISHVEGVEPGLYHLDVENWTLEGIKLEDVRDFSCDVAIGQELARRAAVNFVWTAVLPRCRDKYYERAYRYIFWDVGHIAQNLHIAGNALGLGVCSIGAWADEAMNDYIGIDGKEHFSILMASVGKVEGVDWLKDRR